MGTTRVLVLLLLMVAYGCSSAPEAVSTRVIPEVNPSATREHTTATHTAVPTAPIHTATLTALPPTQAPPTPTQAAEPPTILFNYPIGKPGQPFGDGFFIRHGAVVENTWYNPGYWHTGEDWYAITGDTAGANVYAIAAGTVVYAGGNYPGRVVIMRHSDDLYSMYGHLDPQLTIQVGAQIARGAQIGTVLRRSDTVPNHLHVEVRTFLTTEAVNGSAPRYGFRCGPNCPPGPGYWPIKAPDLPSELGWRIPTHVIAQRMYAPAAQSPLGEVVVATAPISDQIALWSAPPTAHGAATLIESIPLRSGERFPLLAVQAGAEQSRETSAVGYQLWYELRLPDGRSGWVQAASPSTFETGSDGRPSSVYFTFFPVSLNR